MNRKRPAFEFIDNIIPSASSEDDEKPTRGVVKSAWLAMDACLNRLYVRARRSRYLKLVVFLVLVVLVYSFSVKPNKSFAFVRHKFDQSEQMNRDEVLDYLAAMFDTRPPQCKKTGQKSVTNKVSIILEFKREEFYNMKLSLSSVVQVTPEDQYEEIIVLDNSADLGVHASEQAEFFKRAEFRRVKVYKSEEGDGMSSSRFKASQIARGEVLVFLSTDSVVNVGWLSPLLQQIENEPNTIAVPHHDLFLSEKRFFVAEDGLVNVFTWSLSTLHMETGTAKNKQKIDSPTMRGDVFAVQKKFLEYLGNFDSELENSEGQDLELSLRAWLCGGGVKKVLCSRVALHHAMRPIHLKSENNIAKITDLWFASYTKVVMKQTGMDPLSYSANEQAIRIRKSHLHELIPSCQPFEWYLTNVATYLAVPSDNMEQHGKLQLQSNYCAKQMPNMVDIELTLCRNHIYDKAFIFEMDTGGLIRHEDKCLAPKMSDHRVALVSCEESAQGDNQWTMTSSGRLKSGLLPGKCASQVSQRSDTGELWHEIMMLECSTSMDNIQKWTFINA